MLTELNIRFTKLVEKTVADIMQRAETELEKAKYYKEILELPAKKENWSIQDSAEEKMMDHTKKTLALMGDIGVLVEGIKVFQDGLIYRLLKETKIQV